MFALGGFPYGTTYTPILEKGEVGVIFILLNFSTKEEIPAQLNNHLTVEFDGVTQNLFTPSVSVNLSQPIVISPPLLGEHWMTPNAISNTNAHRRALIVLDGQMYLSQRFAVDWLKYDEKGDWYKGDPEKNESYYDAPALLLRSPDMRRVCPAG